MTCLGARSASLGCCGIVGAWQFRARFQIHARYLDHDRGVSHSIHVAGVPTRVGPRIWPLVLSLEPATDL